MRLSSLIVLCLFQTFFICAQDLSWSSFQYQKSINEAHSSPVVIAVIDDAFRLTHESLTDFIYENNQENPFNQKDDDQNGYIDDYLGFDISDNDKNVSLPEIEIHKYNHGTFISGTICNYLESIFGDKSQEHFKILPIKVVSDSGNPNRILDGYKGIEYAIKQNVDIIVCAWNGGSITSEESKIIQQAHEKGITILSSAGNAFNDLAQPPASVESVIAVAALDTNLQKLDMSNYGSFVDLCAPGEAWRSPYVGSDTSYFEGKGTSLAVALTAAVVVAMKNQNPNLSPIEIRSILKNSASPFQSISPRFRGKLGAGFINPSQAIEMAENPNLQEFQFNTKLPEGVIYIESSRKNKSIERVIEPIGDFYRTSFKLEYVEPYDPNLSIDIIKDDNVIHEWKSLDLINLKHVEETGLKVRIKPNLENVKIMLSYESELLDSTNYFCSEIKEISGIKSISDESGEDNYVNNTNCKWLITAPPNHRISFSFKEFDTEAQKDFVHLFDGNKALQTLMIAKFSGPKIPPSVTSRTNQVLIWFLTNDNNTRKGWTVNYSFIPDY